MSAQIEERYYVGDRIKITVPFTDADGVAFDPAAFEFRVKTPDGTVTPYAGAVGSHEGGNVVVSNPAVGSWTLSYKFGAVGLHRVVVRSSTTSEEAVTVGLYYAHDPGA